VKVLPSPVMSLWVHLKANASNLDAFQPAEVVQIAPSRTELMLQKARVQTIEEIVQMYRFKSPFVTAITPEVVEALSKFSKDGWREVQAEVVPPDHLSGPGTSHSTLLVPPPPTHTPFRSQNMRPRQSPGITSQDLGHCILHSWFIPPPPHTHTPYPPFILYKN